MWMQFYNEQNDPNKLKIPRNIIDRDFNLIDLHYFGDASISAYTRCVHLRSINPHRHHNGVLLCSKPKVSSFEILNIS